MARSGDSHGSEEADDLRDHGLLGEELEPDAEDTLDLRVARTDLVGHAYRNVRVHHLD